MSIKHVMQRYSRTIKNLLCSLAGETDRLGLVDMYYRICNPQ